jgi:hypothetical protein
MRLGKHLTFTQQLEASTFLDMCYIDMLKERQRGQEKAKGVRLSWYVLTRSDVDGRSMYAEKSKSRI